MKPKPIAAFVGDPTNIERVYAKGRHDRVAELTRLCHGVLTAEEILRDPAAYDNLEVIFSTWGMPALSEDVLSKLSSLKAVFYAAGTVQAFARPFIEREIVVVSAWQANALPVAEFTLAQTILALKGCWRSAVRSRNDWQAASYGPGSYGETVALLGAGAVGQALIRLLKPLSLKVIVYDPFLTEADAADLGVRKVSLNEAFALGMVVSNHIPNKPETRKLIGEQQFELMRDGATFINTGRGATVDEDALVKVFSARPSLTALLDVTDPEPPEDRSPLYKLANIHLTPHIAGPVADELARLADLCIDEFLAFRDGRLLTSAVTLSMLDRLA